MNSQTADDATVQTSLGPVRGTAAGGLTLFAGIL